MRSSPRAVVLDFGGVVWDMRWDVSHALEAEHGLPRDSSVSALYRSAEVGCAKPDPEIFALACRRLDAAPAACVFVDDHEPNVRAAEAAGLLDILYRADRGDDLARLLAAAGVTTAAGRPPAR